jgi:aldehyde dehydrogenase (NAD(P)+)
MTGSFTRQQPHVVETAPEEVAGIVQCVSEKADEWKSLPIEEKIFLLEQIIANAIRYKDEWVALQQEARGVSPNKNVLHGYGHLDILVSGPATFGSYANGILTSLKEISRTGGAPPRPIALRTTTNGKTIATVWPDGFLDSLEAFGMTAELVLPGDSTRSDIDEGVPPPSVQQTFDEVSVGGVAAVLAAGNFDAPTDLLCQLFLKGRVCVYKPNPVNKQSIDVLEKIIEPLITLGYVAFVKGGVLVGTALVRHEALDEIVLTGSAETLNKIQWGSTPKEQEENKRTNTPIIQTPVCSELGAVNSWVVVPGPQWNKRSVDKHARALAFAKLANNGHICVSPQVLVLPKDWIFRKEFLDRLRFWLGQHPGGPPFYPGSPTSHAFFREHPGAELIPGTSPDAYPDQQRPILIPNASLGDESLLRREAWCPTLVELPIDYEQSEEDPMGYLQYAVQCIQTNTHGSLSIAILINDKTVQNKKEEFDALVADMPFGIVGINIWPIFAHSMAQLQWGAFPGYNASGNGSLGNARLYRNPEKSVLRAPFSYLPRRSVEIMPPRKAGLLFSRLASYKLRPNLLTQAALFTALLFGA